MADARHAESAEEDPRRALARKRLEAARAELVAKEADKPHAQRKRAAGPAGAAPPPGLTLSLSPTVFVHAILLMIAITLAALALVWCYVLMNIAFLAGRAVALATGVLATLALSYASGCYLGIVESTSHGHTTVEDALQGDYRDWFWSLPMTLGMAALAGVIGWLISLLGAASPWTLIGVTMMILTPILQLSSLETGSPLAPISLPVLRSMVTRPLAWLAFYAVSSVVVFAAVALANATWRDPPYTTMLIMGPTGTVALLVYGWLLGQLARWISAYQSFQVED